MSLKFGLYLVEQGIISCDQFCGLVKIQQTSLPSMGSIAIKRNLMTVKQVSHVLDFLELNPGANFVETSRKLDYIDAEDARQLDIEQQSTLPAIRRLVVECGLMTSAQADVLVRTFEKSQMAQPDQTVIRHSKGATHRPEPIRQPKFRQRPIVVSAFEDAY